MALRTARRIIEAFAEGIDPSTGEVLDEKSVVQSPDVIRALHVALASMDRHLLRQRRESNLPANAGKSWSPQEAAELIAMFERGESIAEIARAFARTPGGITARLIRLGKIEEK